MKVDLNDIACHSEWCSEWKSQQDVRAWLESSSLKVFYTSNLIDKFGYKDCEEIEKSGHFIPVLKTDTLVLKKEFISRFHKELEDEVKAYMDGKNYGFDLAFRKYIDEYFYCEPLDREYENFERNRFVEEAEKWCVENGIPYYTANDSDRVLDLRDTIAWSYGTWLMEDDGSMSPQTVWYCRANCEIMDYSKVDVVYGYKDNDEIMASGDFVPLFKVMQEDVEVEIDNVEDKKLHEERYILEHAKKWCEENNIPYYISKDGPDHLGSKLTTEKTGDGSM